MNWFQIACVAVAGLSFAWPLVKWGWNNWPAKSTAVAVPTTAAGRVALWEQLRQACVDGDCTDAVAQLDAVFAHLAGGKS